MTLRERLIGPPPAFGTWVAIDNPLSAETIGRVGFDAAVIDLQHGGADEAMLLTLLHALQLAGTPALVRVRWPEPSAIMRAADLGAAGVIVPMVNSAAEAEAVVAAIRLPPRGIRSFGPVRRWYAADETTAEPLCIVMIETAQALDELAAIAATPGLDGLLVGPVDLALSLGHPASLDMPMAVLDAIGTVANTCRANRLICASVSFGPDNATLQLARGVTFLASGSDAMFMTRAATAELAALRGLVGKG